ncbi:hypothetical protein [Mycolicibacterium sp.]|uniref:hypothetical protein n=1 Tax=Mycolicibacterium sp. TaxID=2320850 RepID=UPI00355FF65B
MSDDDNDNDDNELLIEFTHLPNWVNVFLCDNGRFRWEATPGVISDSEFIYPSSFTPLQCGIERDFSVFDMRSEREVAGMYGKAAWDVANICHEIEQDGIDTEVISKFDIVVTLHTDTEPETVVFEGYDRLDVLPPSAQFAIEDSAMRFILENDQREIEP